MRSRNGSGGEIMTRQYFYGRDGSLFASLGLEPDGWHVKDAKGGDLGVFPTREYAVAFINAARIKSGAVQAASVASSTQTKRVLKPSGMQRKRTPKPIFRSKLAHRYRMTRKAERERQRQRERHAAEYAAYESRQPELIKKEKIERGRG
jgi:hypothetical protein